MLNTRPVRVPLRGIPFVVNSGTSGTGGLVSANSGASLTNANSVPIDPFTLGGRCSALAADFLMYRIKWIRFVYNPYGSASGVAVTPAGLTTTPSYAERAFAWGCVDDSGISGSLSYQLLVEYGARVCRTSQLQSFTLRGGTLSQWRYTSTTSASPTAIDLRMIAPVKLWFYFADTSTTLSTSYGAITYDAVFEFRGAADNLQPIGLDEVKQRDSEDYSLLSKGTP